MNQLGRNQANQFFIRQMGSGPKKAPDVFAKPKMLHRSPTEKLLDHRLPTFHIKKHSLVFKNDSEEETQRQHAGAKPEPRDAPPRHSKSIFYEDLESSKKCGTSEANSKQKSSKKNFVDTFCENTFRQKSKKQQFTFKKSNRTWNREANAHLLSLDSREINNFRSSENSDQLLTSKREAGGLGRGVYDNIVLSIRDISNSKSSRTSINRDTLRSHRLKLKENVEFDFCVNKNEFSATSQKTGARAQISKINGNKFSFEANNEDQSSETERDTLANHASSRSRAKGGIPAQSPDLANRQRKRFEQMRRDNKRSPRLEKRRKKKLSIETKNPHLGNQTWNMNSYKRLSEEFGAKNNFTFKSKKKIIYDGFEDNLSRSGAERKVKDMRPGFAIPEASAPLGYSRHVLSLPKRRVGQLSGMMARTLEIDQLEETPHTRERFYSITCEKSGRKVPAKRQSRPRPGSRVPLKKPYEPEKNIILSIKDLTPKQDRSVNMRKQNLKRLLLSNEKSTPCFEKCLSTKSIQKTPKVKPKQLFKSTKKISLRKQSSILKESAKKLVTGDHKPPNVIVYSRSKNKTSSKKNLETVKKRHSKRGNGPSRGINSRRISSMLQSVEQSSKEIYSRLKHFESDYRNLTANPGRAGVYNPSFMVKKDVFPKRLGKRIEKIDLDFQKKEAEESAETLHRETDLMNSSDLLSNRSNKIFTWAPKSNENSQVLNSLINNIPITESYKSRDFLGRRQPFDSLKIQKISNYNYNHMVRMKPNPFKNNFSKVASTAANFGKILSHRKKKSQVAVQKGAKEGLRKKDVEVQPVSKENELRKLLRKNRRTPKSKVIAMPKDKLFSDVKFSQMDWLPKKKFNSYNKYSSLNRPKKAGFRRKNESLYHCISPMLSTQSILKNKLKKDCICCSNWRYNFNNFLHKKI